jgi:hypothetical protein
MPARSISHQHAITRRTAWVFTLAIARRLGVSVFPPRAICAALKLPWTLAATMLCHASLMHPLSGSLRDANFRSEREKCGLLPDTQGRPNHDRPADHPVTSRETCEGAVLWLTSSEPRELARLPFFNSSRGNAASTSP